MKLSAYLKRIKLEVPNQNQTGIGDNYLTELLNQAVDQVNLLTKVYKTFTDFNIVADKRIYDLSVVAPFYLGTDKRGFFFKNTSDKWDGDVRPKTEAWLSQRYPDYLNASSAAIPRWVWIDGNELGLYPPPSTAKTDGARLFHLRKSIPMSTEDHYPFTGSGVQITAFIALDDAILAYVKWKLAPAFGNVSDVDLREREFIKECRKGAKQVKRRRDLTNDSDYGMFWDSKSGTSPW